MEGVLPETSVQRMPEASGLHIIFLMIVCSMLEELPPPADNRVLEIINPKVSPFSSTRTVTRNFGD
jgi:hypothetical protein